MLRIICCFLIFNISLLLVPLLDPNHISHYEIFELRNLEVLVVLEKVHSAAQTLLDRILGAWQIMEQWVLQKVGGRGSKLRIEYQTLLNKVNCFGRGTL